MNDMPKLTFRSRDLTTALEAARKAGIDVRRVEISPDGRIILRMERDDHVWDATVQEPHARPVAAE